MYNCLSGCQNCQIVHGQSSCMSCWAGCCCLWHAALQSCYHTAELNLGFLHITAYAACKNEGLSDELSWFLRCVFLVFVCCQYSCNNSVLRSGSVDKCCGEGMNKLPVSCLCFCEYSLSCVGLFRWEQLKQNCSCFVVLFLCTRFILSFHCLKPDSWPLLRLCRAWRTTAWRWSPRVGRTASTVLWPTTRTTLCATSHITSVPTPSNWAATAEASPPASTWCTKWHGSLTWIQIVL